MVAVGRAPGSRIRLRGGEHAAGGASGSMTAMLPDSWNSCHSWLLLFRTAGRSSGPFEPVFSQSSAYAMVVPHGCRGPKGRAATPISLAIWHSMVGAWGNQGTGVILAFTDHEITPVPWFPPLFLPILKSISQPSPREFAELLKAARRQARQAGMTKADVGKAIRKARRA